MTTQTETSKNISVDNNNKESKVNEPDDALSDGCFPIFKSPYNQFYQWSKNLVELDISWRIPPPQMEWSKYEWLQGDKNASKDPPEIIHSSRDVVFDYLNNLTSLSISGYPFAYISDKIGNLSNLVSLNCYGSKMICMPRTMHKLKKLTKFTPYTSYLLHYLPYEISECPLNDTTISTGALYNNCKNKMLFPPLPQFPNTYVSEINKFVFNKQQLKEYILSCKCILNIGNLNELIVEYAIGDSTYCSICKIDILIEYLYYVWVFKRIGTDNVGLLGRMCPICIETHIKQHDFVSIADYELKNEKCKTQSIREMCMYDLLSEDEFDIREIMGGKYFGGEYKKENVLKSWMYFWRYNLKMDFYSYELYTNMETNEVNVKLLSND